MFYAWTRGRRQKRGALGWMAIPLLFHAGIYIWILFFNPPLEARVFPIRSGDIVEKLLLTYVTLLLGITNYKNG